MARIIPLHPRPIEPIRIETEPEPYPPGPSIMGMLVVCIMIWWIFATLLWRFL